MMKLVSRGAEATLYESLFLGEKCIVKVREPKTYREKSLDLKIRKERLRTECSLLSRAKEAMVRTPLIYSIDSSGFAITMEYVPGKSAKEMLLQENGAKKICEKIGIEIAKLHSSGIVHGDLTTSNIIVSNGNLVFVDFGLGSFSQKIEDFAVDMLALKKTFLATHFKLAKEWNTIERTYCTGYARGAEVLTQMKKVEARARYY